MENNEPKNNFGAELAQIAVQFSGLMQAAAKRGFLAGPQRQEHKQLLREIKQIADDTDALLEAPVTSQEAVDAMAARYQALMPRVLGAMVLETDKAN